MNYQRFLQWMTGFTLVAFFLSACGAQQTSAVPTDVASPGAGTEFSDPFAYCATVGTIDAPDALYVGPPVPDMLIEGMKKAGVVSDEIPNDMIVGGTVWRCMDGEVWTCFGGANLPCMAKADTGQAPSPAMTDFCKEEPNSDFIPAAVAGRETIYEWRCADGAPEIVKQVFEPDARGFLSDFWYKISLVEPTESGAGMPNPSASYCAELGYENENGDCVFHDGTKCNSWAFYRGACGQEKTYCEQQGFKIENRVEEVGSATYEYAVCVFADGSECLEEEYLAGECNPSDCEKWLLSRGGCVTN